MALHQTSPSISSNSSDMSSIPFLSSISYDGANPRSTESNHSWDVAACCQPLVPTFRYLSSKLAFQGLHVAIIVLGTRPELLSAWPIDIHTQRFLSKLVTRADIKYSLDHAWVGALNSLCKPLNPGEAFELYRGTTYLVHRSLLQKDIIYSGDGLTVLAVDYIYKFKEQLSFLAVENTFPSIRGACKESCVSLLKHINGIYKDIPLSQAYLRRAYFHLPLREDVLEEVYEAYYSKYDSSSALNSPTLDCNTSSLYSAEASTTITEQYQESPRKLPISPPKLKRSKTFAARARINEARSNQNTPLGSPFEFDPLSKRPTNHEIERPKSPKGDLFESPRSVPTTPPKRPEIQGLSEPPGSQPLMISSPSFLESLDSNRAETASTISSRRKKFFASWLTLPRSTTASSGPKNSLSSHSRALDITQPSVAGRLNGPRPPPTSASRCSSISKSTPVFLVREHEMYGSSYLEHDTLTNDSQFALDSNRPYVSRASESKFGWFHAMKKGNGWGIPSSQRVL